MNKTRNFAIALIGIFIGCAWLVPVYHLPSVNFLTSYQNSPVRYLRVAAPLTILLIARPRFPRRQLSLNNIFILLFFFLVPFLSLTFSSTPEFFLYGSLPIFVAGSVLGASTSLTSKELHTLATWVGIVALVLVTIALFRFGIAPNYMFGRPRTHFGFSHPIHSASALVAAAFGLNALFLQMHPRWKYLRWLLQSSLLLFTSWTLWLAASRNIALFFASFCTGYFVLKTLPRHRWLHQLMYIGSVVFLFGYSLLPLAVNAHSPWYQTLDRISSYRISLNSSFLEALTKNFSLKSIFSEPCCMPFPPMSVRMQFASFDSILFTVIGNYGLLAGVTLYMGLILSGYVAMKQRDPLRMAAWIGFIFASTFDAQGLTTSNALLFYSLCLIIREPSKGSLLSPKKSFASPISDGRSERMT